MKLTELVETSRAVRATRSRLAKVEALTACLERAARADALRVSVCFLSGRIRQGRIGIGPAALRQARPARAAGEPGLGVAEVDAVFEALPAIRGPGSAARRLERLRGLLERASEAEQTFLVRLLLGELRQGALEGLVLEAVARAARVAPEAVRRAAMLEGDLARVAEVAVAEGETGLARSRLELFRPLQPMLASPADDVEEALAQLGRAGFEWKLDGARVQAHKQGGEVRVFTRRLHEVSAAVPELVEAVAALPARELVLDGEALALRPDGRPHAFQTTMRRFGRRLNVAAERAALPLRVFFFDCLQLDGQMLIDRPGGERVRALAEALPEALRMPRIESDDPAEAAAFRDEALARGHEGVMAKSLAAPYAAGARGAEWLKLKPAHGLDLVVLAAEWGSGRRRGWLSNLHLGARDPASGSFVMLGKTFKGLSDELLEWQTRRLQELEVGRDEWGIRVKPRLVVEIALSGVQASPHYPAGLALRFARVKRYRPDKGPEQADTVETVRALAERTTGTLPTRAAG